MPKNIIHSRAPLRISFVGGGTDLPSYYLNNSYGSVISTAINKYVYVTIKKHPEIFDEKIRLSYSSTESLQDVDSIKNNIIRAALKFLNINEGIHVLTYADVPASTGLGSSSAFTVALLMALHRFRGDYFTLAQIAEEACYIEMEILDSKVGKQDQYASALGGLNYLKFHDDNSVSLQPIHKTANIFLSLISKSKLYFTGHLRSASKILEEQVSGMQKKEEHYNKLKNLTEKCLLEIKKGTLTEDHLNKFILKGWILKKQLSRSIVNYDINKIADFAMDSGAFSIKLLGAGGGGFLLVSGSKELHREIHKEFNLKQINFSISSTGATVYSEL